MLNRKRVKINLEDIDFNLDYDNADQQILDQWDEPDPGEVFEQLIDSIIGASAYLDIDEFVTRKQELKNSWIDMLNTQIDFRNDALDEVSSYLDQCREEGIRSPSLYKQGGAVISILNEEIVRLQKDLTGFTKL
jgi:hypothetical protein